MQASVYQKIIKQSLISNGNNRRMKQVLNKVEDGGNIIIAYLGGSNTEHYNGGYDGCYARLSYLIFNQRFGNGDNATYVNAGMAGTTSLLGLVRVERDVLRYQPDIIFVEYSVNDSKDSLHREAFESLLLRLLNAPKKPAVVLVFMRNKAGYTCQGQMQAVGEYYELPMISINDAITPELEEKTMLWSEYSDDYVHPDKNGHRLVADCIAYYYDTVASAPMDEEFVLPKTPLYGNSFVDMKLLDSTNSELISPGSFKPKQTIYQFPHGWIHSMESGNQPFRIKFNGKKLYIIYKESSDYQEGNAEVYVDGEMRLLLSGYNSTGWDNPILKPIIIDNTQKEHRIEIKMAPGDEEKQFSLLAFGYCDIERSKLMAEQQREIKLPKLISDGMVLQRQSDIKLWGWAPAEESLRVTFLGEQYEAKVKKDGSWEMQMKELQAGGPFEMTITCSELQKTIKDIYIGDVWVLGGQSNMEISVARTLDLFEDEVKDAECSAIRKFSVPQVYNFHGPVEELNSGSWEPVTPKTVYSFSAIGYFYAKNIYEKYKIPIGLLHTAIGGTPVEAWISEKSLLRFGKFQEMLSLCKDDDYVNGTKIREELRNNEWYSDLYRKDTGYHDNKGTWFGEGYDDSDWSTMELPNSFRGTELETLKGSVWFRKEIIIPENMTNVPAKLFLGTIIDGDDTYINGVQVGTTGYLYPPRRYNIPEGLLKTGRNVITVRVILTSNIGAFVTDMPYLIKANGEELSISGTWKYRMGVSTEAMAPTTFFQYKPSGVYNHMIYPLRNFSIKGVLWYQGESNTGYPYDYKELFEAVIKDWRANWGLGDIPFYYVQLANYCPWRMEPDNSGWAKLRDEQRKVLEVANTGMAVILDVGMYNDLHPWDKKTVGERLALWTMKNVFGEDIVCSGPIYDRMKVEGDKIRLHFRYTGSGLTMKGNELKTFMICGMDGKYIAAQAVIDMDTVLVSSSQVKNPVAARYAWSDNPEAANLYNYEGLPASPFTTEH